MFGMGFGEIIIVVIILGPVAVGFGLFVRAMLRTKPRRTPPEKR